MAFPRLTNDSVILSKGSGPPSTLKVPFHTFGCDCEQSEKPTKCNEHNEQICSWCLWGAQLTRSPVSHGAERQPFTRLAAEGIKPFKGFRLCRIIQSESAEWAEAAQRHINRHMHVAGIQFATIQIQSQCCACTENALQPVNLFIGLFLEHLW